MRSEEEKNNKKRTMRLKAEVESAGLICTRRLE